MVFYCIFWSGQFRTVSCKYKTMTSLPKYGEGYAEFEIFAYIARRYNSAAESTSLLISVASLAITTLRQIEHSSM